MTENITPRTPSVQFENWDYEKNTPYFVTISTKEKSCFFGNVIRGKMHLSDIGQFAENYLKEIPKRYPYLKMDAFVVMPNHIHAIITLNKKTDVSDQKQNKEILSSIFGSYKSVVTKSAISLSRGFGWQAKLHVQIIRDNKSHENIANYIINNPATWRHDKFYKS